MLASTRAFDEFGCLISTNLRKQDISQQTKTNNVENDAHYGGFR